MLYAVISILTSFGVIYYGLSIINVETAAHGARVFAYVAAGYGLLNVATLSLAWNARANWCLWVNSLFAVCFWGAFVSDTYRAGVKSNLEFVGIICLALVLALNWFAVKKIIQRESK